MPDFKMLLETKEYEFLKTEPRLGRRILLLGLGGSYAYGTANENSDIDFRGVTLNLPSDLLGLTEFEQYEDQHTDTVIYSFNKMEMCIRDRYQVSHGDDIVLPGPLTALEDDFHVGRFQLQGGGAGPFGMGSDRTGGGTDRRTGRMPLPAGSACGDAWGMDYRKYRRVFDKV